MKTILLLASVFFCYLKPGSTQQLNPAFGGKGFVTADFKQGNLSFEAARQVFPQKDGSFIAVIELDGGSVSIARFLPDGKLDATFANKGYSEFLDMSEVKAVQQNDEKIVIAGNSYNGYTNYDFTLTRFNIDGSVDLTFGDDGMVTTDFGSDDYVSSVALQTNGNIVVGGYADMGSSSAGNTNYDFAIARYTGSGSPDISFDRDGKLTHDFYGFEDILSSAAVQADGKIIASGATFKPAICDRCAPEDGENEFVLTRYNSDGSLDRSFNGGGKITTDFGGSANCLALQPDGKILAASGNDDLTLARYNSNGSPDPGFGRGTGYVTTDFGFNDFPSSIALQSNGKIVLSVVSGGFTETESNDFTIARYNSNGTPDATFDGDGKLNTDFGFNDFADAVAVQSDGKIVAAGGSYNTVINNEDFAFSRYNANGSLDNTFSGDGKQLGYYLRGNSDLNSIAVQSDGKIVVAGTGYNSSNSYGFGVARFNSDGSLDAGFDKDGKLLTSFNTNASASSVALQGDKKILVGGSGKLVRYNPDGSLDNTFNKDGKVSVGFSVRDIKVQKNGKVIVAGVSDSDGRFSLALARYKSDGTLDISFGRNGKVSTSFFGENDQAFAVALQSDGKIVVAGHAYNASTGIDFALARYNSNGSPDISFSGDGKTTTDFFGYSDFVNSLAIQANGKIIIAGSSFYDDTNSEHFALARYNSNGSLDKTFNEDGKVTTDFGYLDVIRSISLQSDGKIVAAGLTSDINFVEDIAIARYNKNGSLDTLFDRDGRLITDLGHNERANAAILCNNNLFVAGSNGTKALVAMYDLAAPANKAPVVSINSPANNTVYYPHATITIRASATDADGKISNVKFYNGTALLKTDSISPYTITVRDLARGNYLFTAKATDDQGTSATSAVINITVSDNKAPVVKITNPVNNAVYYAPATINLKAEATDEDGKISNVKFYNGSALLRTEYYYPYTFKWSNVAPGTYSITAKVTDNRGKTTTSSVVRVAVRAALPALSKTAFVNNPTELHAFNLKLAPNPTNNILNIYTSGLQQNKRSTISVISASGIVVKTVQSNGLNKVAQQLDVSSLVNGLYTIKVISGDKIIYKQFLKL